MKIKFLLALFSRKIALLLIVFSLSVLSSCQKDDEAPTVHLEASQAAINKVEDKYLIKFLSINLNVPVEEIKLNNDKSAFLIWGEAFNYIQIEQQYLNGNEYQIKYGQ